MLGKGFYIYLIVFSFLLISCKKNSPNTVEIRVRNSSDQYFYNVSVNTDGTERNYGNVSSGEYSEYKTVNRAYRYAAVKLTTKKDTFGLVPIDYVGENLLKPGKYTYGLNVKEKILNLKFKKDNN